MMILVTYKYDSKIVGTQWSGKYIRRENKTITISSNAEKEDNDNDSDIRNDDNKYDNNDDDDDEFLNEIFDNKQRLLFEDLDLNLAPNDMPMTESV